jgi:predicted RNase H-like nuclease (RuvC/YqgF family)
MTDKKLTDKDVVDGLERCISTTTAEACEGCPFNKQNLCNKDQYALERYALDLINRQKAEADSAKAKIKICAEVIERQDAEIERLKNRISEQKAYTADLQNKIVKLKDYNENLLAANTGLSNEVLEFKAKFDDFITNLLKELVGEEE